MSIADCISRLQAASEDIATAITDMGGVVNSGDGFEEYPADIRTIPTGSATIPVTITASVTTTATTFTLDKAIPVDLSLVFAIEEGATTTATIAAGSTSAVISYDADTSMSRNVAVSITASSYASLFSITYPSSVTIPRQRREVTFTISDITSTGCHITGDDYPSSDVSIIVTFGGTSYTGTMYNDSIECDISWTAPLSSTTASVECDPSSDDYADYLLSSDTITIPAGEQSYTALTYIESTGTQYILTDVTLANGMTIVGKFYGCAPSSSTGSAMGDAENPLWGGGNIFNVINYNTSSYANLYANNGSYQKYVRSSVFLTEEYLKLLVAVDGGTSTSADRYGYIYGTDTSVFDSTSYSAISSNSSSATPSYQLLALLGRWTGSYIRLGVCRFYGLEITEDGSVTHSFIPAMRDSDSAIGVLDETTNTFYENAGTGTFGYA